jgi:ribosomal protein S18 acetylase RimI-like enzyme
MSVHCEASVRTARRADVPPLTDLRIAYLSEMARLEPRLQLLPDVRERTVHALPVWIDQDERILLVAEVPAVTEDGPPVLRGYATGVATVWPPILRNQHVGEVSELYVLPEDRGKGFGRLLLTRLTAALRELGAVVLRAPVPVRNEDSLARFRAIGYRSLQLVLQRSLEEG